MLDDVLEGVLEDALEDALEDVPEVVPEVVLMLLEIGLYMLDVVNVVRCVLWVLGAMLCMLFCILEVTEGELRLLDVPE